MENFNAAYESAHSELSAPNLDPTLVTGFELAISNARSMVERLVVATQSSSSESFKPAATQPSRASLC